MNLAALGQIAGRPATHPLCRMVERAALESRLPPDYLFTSGGPGRYNSRGLACLYASEDLPTAAFEYARYHVGRTTQSVNYWVHAVGSVLDLGDGATLQALELATTDLFVPWRGLRVPGPVATQQLGDAVAAQTKFVGIRFPSDAARARGTTGFNYVFFRSAIRPPASLVVKDDQDNPIQHWP